MKSSNDHTIKKIKIKIIKSSMMPSTPLLCSYLTNQEICSSSWFSHQPWKWKVEPEDQFRFLMFKRVSVQLRLYFQHTCMQSTTGNHGRARKKIWVPAITTQCYRLRGPNHTFACTHCISARVCKENCWPTWQKYIGSDWLPIFV